MGDKMVDLEIEGRKKQLNPRNIAYIVNRNYKINFRGYSMLFLIFTVSITPSIILVPNPISFLVFCLIGLFVSYILYRKMNGDSVQSVGTVNDSYSISRKNMNVLTSTFEESGADCVRFDGLHKTVFTNMNYIYYITPANVVSVDRIDTNIPNIMILSLMVLSLGLTGLSSYSQTGLERISGTTIGLSLLVVTAFFAISNRPDYVEIEFTNGEEKRIPLSPKQAKQMVDYLNGKRDLKEISSGEKVPEIEPSNSENSEIIKRKEDQVKKRD
jgi:hypothetical protein